MPRLLLLLAVLLLAPSALAQNTGMLTGTVTDDRGETLPGATIFLPQIQRGAASDMDGNYTILGIPVGVYDVQFSSVGFASQTISDVQISRDRTRRLDIALSTGQHLNEVTVSTERPIIQSDAIGSARVVSGQDIENLPARRPATASLAAGVVSESGSTDLHVRGSRGGEVTYYVDGVKVVGGSGDVRGHATPGDREGYAPLDETAFRQPADAPLSTFSIDVDRASYANARRFLTSGELPPPDAVRVEEFVNAFDYALAGPRAQDEHPFVVTTETSAAPWADGHRLVRIGLQGRRLVTEDMPPANLVFLVDVSGSMQAHNKLPLLQRAFRMLTRELRAQDRVAIVAYAGQTGVVLPPTRGDDQQTILAAIDGLRAGGSTGGAAGITLAYELARQNFDPNASNRVLLATDGDFNVGLSSDAEMKRLVERERDSGVFLSTLGFGTGNLQDAKMELLANNGNGTYSYIDSAREAERVLVREIGGTLMTIAKDVKLQVEFNPARVAGYRLIGYENRRLTDEEFNDDARDAGDLGAGHTVTALYEIVPVGQAIPGADVDALRYQTPPALSAAADSDELLTIKLRYKPALTAGTFADESVLLSTVAHDVPSSRRGAGALEQASEAMRWAVAVTEAALLLSDSQHAPGASYDHALALAVGARGQDRHGDRAEFVRLIETARALNRSEPIPGQQALRD